MYAIYGNISINIPPMLAYIPDMDPMGNGNNNYHSILIYNHDEIVIYRNYYIQLTIIMITT